MIPVVLRCALATSGRISSDLNKVYAVKIPGVGSQAGGQ